VFRDRYLTLAYDTVHRLVIYYSVRIGCDTFIGVVVGSRFRGWRIAVVVSH
jgi:hypothetical protein